MILDKEQHFVRYCKPVTVQEGHILTSAFHLRKNESGLSGDHFEYFNSSQYRQIIEALKLRGFIPKANGMLAKLKCGDVVTMLEAFNIDSYFERADNSSHTELYGISENDECIVEKLLLLIKDTKQVKQCL